MTISTLTWLHQSWHNLLQQAAQQQLPLALMLTGNQGVGKHQLALHLANWLLCQAHNKQQLATPCYQCHSCQLFKAGNHPDFMSAAPEGNSKQILIGQIRTLNQRLTETPSISERQVLLIHPVELMNLNASNAFLKTLEEPPGNAHILLVSHYYGAVLPTIKSRCQTLNIACPSLTQAHQWLSSQGFSQFEDNQLALAQHAHAPLLALEFLQQGGIAAQTHWEQTLISWINQHYPLQQVIDSWSKLELLELLNRLYKLLLDWGKYAVGVVLLGVSPEIEQLFNQRCLKQIEYQRLQKRILELLAFVHQGIGNYNKTLLLESLLLDVQTISSIAKQEEQT